MNKGGLLPLKLGYRVGRPRIETPENLSELAARWRAGQIPLSDLLERTNMSLTTINRRLKETEAGIRLQ